MVEQYRNTRRGFLAAAAAVGGTMLGGTPLFAEKPEAPAQDFNGFTVGVQTYTFRNFGLEKALDLTRGLGLKYAEFYQKHIPAESTPAQLAAFKKLLGEYGITPIAFGVQRFTKNHDANKKQFEFGKALGIQHFSADPDPDSFDSLDKLCDEYKISIAIHPHGPAGKNELHRWYSAEVIMAAVKDHHELIGTCLDTGHLIRAAQMGKKLDPAQQVRTMGSRNFGLHLKDHDNEKRRDVIYGKGVLDVPAVLKALREVKFKGYISIEYEANPGDPTADVRECVKILKEAAAKV
jgi:sugar phosphate isomerase/epimerase